MKVHGARPPQSVHGRSVSVRRWASSSVSTLPGRRLATILNRERDVGRFTCSTCCSTSKSHNKVQSATRPLLPVRASRGEGRTSGLSTSTCGGRFAGCEEARLTRTEIKTARSVLCLAGLSNPGSSLRDSSESKKVSKDVRQKVENALERLNYSVTVGDVASACGISLLDAERALQALAIDSGAALSVSQEGEVLYQFSKNFRSIIRSKSIAIRLEPQIKRAKDTGAYLLRVGFGTALIASIIIVFAAILVIATSSRSNDRDNRSSSSVGGGLGFRLSPFDFYYPYWDPYYYRYVCYNNDPVTVSVWM